MPASHDILQLVWTTLAYGLRITKHDRRPSLALSFRGLCIRCLPLPLPLLAVPARSRIERALLDPISGDALRPVGECVSGGGVGEKVSWAGGEAAGASTWLLSAVLPLASLQSFLALVRAADEMTMADTALPTSAVRCGTVASTSPNNIRLYDDGLSVVTLLLPEVGPSNDVVERQDAETSEASDEGDEKQKPDAVAVGTPFPIDERPSHAPARQGPLDPLLPWTETLALFGTAQRAAEV